MKLQKVLLYPCRHHSRRNEFSLQNYSASNQNSASAPTGFDVFAAQISTSQFWIFLFPKIRRVRNCPEDMSACIWRMSALNRALSPVLAAGKAQTSCSAVFTGAELALHSWADGKRFLWLTFWSSAQLRRLSVDGHDAVEAREMVHLISVRHRLIVCLSVDETLPTSGTSLLHVY